MKKFLEWTQMILINICLLLVASATGQFLLLIPGLLLIAFYLLVGGNDK